MPKPLGPRARDLRARGEALKSAPVLTRLSGASDLADELAAFLVELAEALDAVRPYLDEEQEEGGATDADA